MGKDTDNAKRWEFLRKICLCFDLLAFQEIMDDFSGLERLRRSLGQDYGLVVSDTTGFTRRGEPVAALVSIKELQLLQELEDQIDIEDAWKAKNEHGEPIPWDELKKELER